LVALAQAVQSEVDGKLRAGGVADQLGNGKGRDFVGAFVQEAGMLDFDCLESANARAQDDGAAGGVFLGEIQTGIFDGIDAAGEGVLHEAIEFFHFFGFEIAIHAKIRDFAADPRTKLRGIETLDHADAAFALDDAGPKFFHAAPQRGHRTKTSYDNAPFHVWNIPAG
jgi:hypothetical protein